MFTRWAVPSGYNEVALTEMFYQGLKPAIKDLMVHIERPGTVTGLLGVAIQYEQSILTRARERGPWTGFKNQRITPKAEIKASRLAPAERMRRLKEGTCFVCDQKGHLARNCPKRQESRVQATFEGSGTKYGGKDAATTFGRVIKDLKKEVSPETFEQITEGINKEEDFQEG